MVDAWAEHQLQPSVNEDASALVQVRMVIGVTNPQTESMIE